MGAGEWGLGMHPLEQWDQQGGEGAERDKSPGIKPGRKFTGGTRSGGSEGREENSPFSLFIPSHPKLRLELKASTGKLSGLQI